MEPPTFGQWKPDGKNMDSRGKPQDSTANFRGAQESRFPWLNINLMDEDGQQLIAQIAHGRSPWS